ncbi:MAG: hypothetical protein HYT30_01680 [Parcubacteria group bacterium]|nr:hypothetical protein [Parcubacteria group bacterium]
MITLEIAKACSSQNAMMDRALRVAAFYGFVPFEEAPMGERAAVAGKIVRLDPKDVHFVRREEKRLMSTVRVCAIRGLGDRRMPAFLCKVVPGDRGSGQTILELHVLGMRTAAAEALLVTVADAIAQELGIEDRIVHINSIGSGESAERYHRELSGFLRKQVEYLTPTQRERMHTDPIATLLSLRTPKPHPMLARAPSSLDYLSEDERRHFWDVLEYLELAGKVYELTPSVTGSNDCWAHTMFELSYPQETSEGIERVPFALGGRYDTLLTRSLGQGSSGAHIAITFGPKPINIEQLKKPRWKPAAYFAHLSVEAKRRSIPVLETLRQAEIPVYHSLAFDQLAPQMAVVKRLNLPWLIIMGHKEALANEVAVRNIRTNAQDSVPIPELADYLKRRHVGV